MNWARSPGRASTTTPDAARTVRARQRGVLHCSPPPGASGWRAFFCHDSVTNGCTRKSRASGWSVSHLKDPGPHPEGRKGPAPGMGTGAGRWGENRGWDPEGTKTSGSHSSVWAARSRSRAAHLQGRPRCATHQDTRAADHELPPEGAEAIECGRTEQERGGRRSRLHHRCCYCKHGVAGWRCWPSQVIHPQGENHEQPEAQDRDRSRRDRPAPRGVRAGRGVRRGEQPGRVADPGRSGVVRTGPPPPPRPVGATPPARPRPAPRPPRAGRPAPVPPCRP